MITSPSAKFVFGDFNVHEKDWLTYSGGTHRPAERVIIFLSQMTFISWLTLLLSRIPDCDSQSPVLLDVFLSSDSSICSTMASFHWEILIMLLCQFPLTFRQSQNGMPRFIA